MADARGSWGFSLWSPKCVLTTIHCVFTKKRRTIRDSFSFVNCDGQKADPPSTNTHSRLDKGHPS